MGTPLPPVPLDQMLVLVNRFVSTTVTHLNEFALDCEQRLGAVSKRLKRLKAELDALEEKMEDLESPEEESYLPIVTREPPVGDVRKPVPMQNETVVAVVREVVVDVIRQEQVEIVREERAQEAGTDLRVAKYKAMLKVGIPKEAVLHKMKTDGVSQELWGLL